MDSSSGLIQYPWVGSLFILRGKRFQFSNKLYFILKIFYVYNRERSGSVVECWTRDRGAMGRASPASLCCVLEQEH